MPETDPPNGEVGAKGEGGSGAAAGLNVCAVLGGQRPQRPARRRCGCRRGRGGTWRLAQKSSGGAGVVGGVPGGAGGGRAICCGLLPQQTRPAGSRPSGRDRGSRQATVLQLGCDKGPSRGERQARWGAAAHRQMLPTAQRGEGACGETRLCARRGSRSCRPGCARSLGAASGQEPADGRPVWGDRAAPSLRGRRGTVASDRGSGDVSPQHSQSVPNSRGARVHAWERRQEGGNKTAAREQRRRGARRWRRSEGGAA